MSRTIALAGALHSELIHQRPPRLIQFQGAHAGLHHLAKTIQDGRRRTPRPPHLFLILETLADHEPFFLRMDFAFNQKERILLTCGTTPAQDAEQKRTQKQLSEMKENQGNDQVADRRVIGTHEEMGHGKSHRK